MMDKEEVFEVIFRNNHPRSFGVELLAGFLDIPDDMAKAIFDTEYAEYERKRLECLPDALRAARTRPKRTKRQFIA